MLRKTHFKYNDIGMLNVKGQKYIFIIYIIYNANIKKKEWLHLYQIKQINDGLELGAGRRDG